MIDQDFQVTQEVHVVIDQVLPSTPHWRNRRRVSLPTAGVIGSSESPSAPLGR